MRNPASLTRRCRVSHEKRDKKMKRRVKILIYAFIIAPGNNDFKLFFIYFALSVYKIHRLFWLFCTLCLLAKLRKLFFLCKN